MWSWGVPEDSHNAEMEGLARVAGCERAGEGGRLKGCKSRGRYGGLCAWGRESMTGGKGLVEKLHREKVGRREGLWWVAESGQAWRAPQKDGV